VNTTAPPRASFQQSMDALTHAQKSSKGAPAYSRLVNRPLGRVFAAAANARGLRPNQVTAASAACTFSALVLVAATRATVLTSLVTAALLVVGYALDAADGQLARIQGTGSPLGEWLDHTVDAVKAVAVHLAVAINWYRFEDASISLLLIPIGFLAVDSVMFFVIILNDHLRRLHPRRDGTAPRATSSSLLYSLAVIPGDYGVLCLVFALGWWHTGFTVAYAAMGAGSAAMLIVGLPRWYRQISSLGR